MSVQCGYLFTSPFSIADPFIFVKKILHFNEDVHLLFRFFVVGSLNLLIQVVDSINCVLQIFQHKLGADDFHISDWVHIGFSVSYVFIFKGSHYMENTIDLFDIAQEMVS